MLQTTHRALPPVFALALAAVHGTAFADVSGPDPLVLHAGLQQIWDSNFDRSQDDVSERQTVGSAGFRVNGSWGRQRLTAQASAARYMHARRDFLDATTYDGGIAWLGEIGSRFDTRLRWHRRERPADRLEFTGKDLIRLTEREATLIYNVTPRVGLEVSALAADQRHSNSERRRMEYNDRGVSSAISYSTERDTRIALRYTQGDREYPNVPPPEPSDALDYDYMQLELEADWALTSKAMLLGTVGYFNRDGDVNEGSGLFTTWALHWEITDRTRLESGVSYTQPPVGDTIDNPSEDLRIFTRAFWQWTPKIQLKAEARAAEQSFDGVLDDTPARDERIYSVTPFGLEYTPTDYLTLELEATWHSRESELDFRDYSGETIMVGVRGQF
ncbi:MAG: hypothetical protein JJU06_09340 [Ectothiorhodospiraceae bacterium]|nr:hypothetical protein [Ectothiorhodospiraceae bacterium]MCH8504042.1 hypothetical protein [Ectothiorhodospiraceae bacterium]